MPFFGSSESDKIVPIFDLKMQSVPLSVKTAERISHLSNNVDGKLPDRLFDDAKTVYEGFRRGARVSKNGDCLGYRQQLSDGKMPYVWIKYDDVIRRSVNVARGIIEKGLAVGQQTMIVIYAANRPEWIITEQACYVYSMVSVPLYDSLGLEACSFILSQTEAEILFVDKSSKAERMIADRSKFPKLKILVMYDKPESTLIAKATELGMEVIEFKDLESLGVKAANPKPDQPPSPSDLATVCYSSGTTGMPKGAMLTHLNVMADLTAIQHLRRSAPNREDVMISYLPLAHMFERVIETFLYTIGAKVGFYRGEIRFLMEDLLELKPTIMPTVPRLLNRVYDKVMQEINSSFIKRWVFSIGMRSKMKEVKNGIIRNDSLWDSYVFKKIQDSLGGRLRLMLTGSAPLSEEVMNFCRATMGCVVVEGYGQTECVAGATLTIEGDTEPCHVGPPIPCCKIKMVDVPEMNYFAKNGSGEVCLKGPNVMKGYYKQPEQTAEALDIDGWLHTGDIGQWTKEGTLKLIDRKKHIFKLSQGEYIAPEKIENVYIRNRFVVQCFVHGESLRSYLVGVVVPENDQLIPAVKRELGVSGTIEELCKMAVVKKFVLKEMQETGRFSGLQSFEQVKVIHLYPEPFTVENDLLTPTFKAKRIALKRYFEVQIAQMYESSDPK